MDPSGWANGAAGDEGCLAEVADAVWHDRRLRVRHRRSDGRTSERTLDPLGLVHKTGAWYLVAAMGGDPRVYRVDRIRSAQATREPA
jgi:predicted DNA-binding transcriptional regulator YafY